MVKPFEVKLRKYDFDTASCEICRYYKEDFCEVLEIIVNDEQVCDAYQGDEKKFKPYEVEDAMAFAKGMKIVQPYKHVVIKGIDTPVGVLLIIEDTMRPKPHRFSLDMKFSIEHTSKEHHWTQKEVNTLIRIGKGKIL